MGVWDTPGTIVATEKSEGDDTQDTLKVKKKKSQTIWIKPKRIPTAKEERKLFGKSLEMLLVTCMDNHLYQFANEDSKARGSYWPQINWGNS